MLKKDHILLGLIGGILAPIVFYSILLIIKDGLIDFGILPELYGELPTTIRTIGVLAICINLIFIELFNRNKFIKSMRGIVFPTLGYVCLWFYKYSGELFFTQ